MRMTTSSAGRAASSLSSWIAEARQPLHDFVGEFQPGEILPVAGADLGLLRDLADQADDEARLVDQAEIAEELDFGLNVHPAGKKSMGLVAVRVATSLRLELEQPDAREQLRSRTQGR